MALKSKADKLALHYPFLIEYAKCGLYHNNRMIVGSVHFVKFNEAKQAISEYDNNGNT